MGDITKRLQTVVQKLNAGQRPTMSLRELLKAVDAERRGTRVVEDIRRHLGIMNLRTVPDFEDEHDLSARLEFEFCD